MLRIVAVAYEVIRELRPLLVDLKRVDANLEDQLRRALQSMVQNTSEGSPQVGKRRALHYSYALGSAREAWTCLELCAAFGYVASIEPYRNRFDQIIGTLMIVLHGRRAA